MPAPTLQLSEATWAAPGTARKTAALGGTSFSPTVLSPLTPQDAALSWHRPLGWPLCCPLCRSPDTLTPTLTSPGTSEWTPPSRRQPRLSLTPVCIPSGVSWAGEWGWGGSHRARLFISCPAGAAGHLLSASVGLGVSLCRSEGGHPSRGVWVCLRRGWGRPPGTVPGFSHSPTCPTNSREIWLLLGEVGEGVAFLRSLVSICSLTAVVCLHISLPRLAVSTSGQVLGLTHLSTLHSAWHRGGAQ